MYSEEYLNEMLVGSAILHYDEAIIHIDRNHLKPLYRAIFDKISHYATKGIKGLDLAVQHDLNEDDIVYLAQIAPVVFNIQFYADELTKLKAYEQLEKIINQSQEIKDVEEQKAFLVKNLTALKFPKEKKEKVLLGEQIEGWEANFEAKWNGQIKQEIISNFPFLDDQNLLDLTNLTVIAAQPGMGKTTLALNVACNVSQNKTGVLFISLEMSKDQIISKIVSYLASVPIYKILNPAKYSPLNQEYERIVEAQESMKNLPMFLLDSSSGLSRLDVLLAEIRNFVTNNDCKLVVIDYLLLIQLDNLHKSTNRAQEVSTITRSLKALAQELNICILALTQLNRTVNQSKDKMPELFHLKESGSIEADANNVIFIHRPSVFEETPENKDLAIVKIAKARLGELKQENIIFRGELSMFKQLNGLFKNQQKGG